MYSLEEIISPINDELKRVEKEFSRLLQTSFQLITGITGHLNLQPGKRLRPILVLLGGYICGRITPKTYKAAALLEMLHNATLIHDDVVDDAPLRRGNPTFNTLLKNKISVLIGDYILARLLLAMVELNNLRAIKLLAETSVRMTRGEIAQLISPAYAGNNIITETEYIHIISDKTASLISASCQLGALMASASDEQIAALKNYGEKIGQAFQIRDDILDIEGTEEVLGKQKGADIKNGKLTLPLLYALNTAPSSQKNKMVRIISRRKRSLREKKNGPTDIEEVLHFINKSGGTAYARQYALRLSEEAKEELAVFPDSVYKMVLVQLSDYIVHREK